MPPRTNLADPPRFVDATTEGPDEATARPEIGLQGEEAEMKQTGCVSQGGTRDEVMRNIRETADLYIEDCIAAGDPVPTEAGREYCELVTGTHLKLPTDLSGQELVKVLLRVGLSLAANEEAI